MATAMLPSVSTLIAAEKMKEAKEKIGLSIKTTMLISIPCAVGLFVLAEPIINLLFSNTSADLKTAGGFLMALSLSTVFYALSTLNSSILQGIGKVNTPIINAAIALVAQTVIAVVLLITTNLGVYSIAIATTLYAGLMCLLNQYSVKKAIAYRQEYKKSFFIPMLAAMIMGVCIKLVYEGIYLLSASMKVSVILAILSGMVVYLFLLIVLKYFTKQELEVFTRKGNRK
jgi:stage V sporulation protein B